MKIEIEVKYAIGDVVLVKDTSGNGGYVRKSNLPVKATISGYTITKDKRKTTVYYFIEPIKEGLNQWQVHDLINATSHRRRYPAKWLEKVEEE